MAEKSKSYLGFKLYNEHFAINVHKVLEVLLEYRLVELPDAPKYIEGMLNFRGEIIPVVNFRKKFNFPEKEDNQNVIIVVDINIGKDNIKFGAVVDNVKNVFEVEENELKNIPEFGSKYNPEYLQAVVNKNDIFFMILNIEKVFTDKEIRILNKLEE